jgi:hypothetical protein
MIFPRRIFHEAIEVLGTLSIAAGVFLVLSRHVPVWAAAVMAAVSLGASVWAGF